MEEDTLLDSKIQQLHNAFADLKTHQPVTLNLKWPPEIPEKAFYSAPRQEKKFETKTLQALEEVKAGTQNNVSERELSALKAVTKCIEEHKLENEYPLDSLQKRILQLERAKADKKQAAEAVKPQSKRPRANGVVKGCGPLNTNIAAAMRDGRPLPPYPRPPENRVHPFTYNMGPPTHWPYFGKVFQYQASYLH